MKKTNLFFSLSMLVALMMLVASCSKSVEYTNVIPADASMVVSLDVKSLAQKSGVKDDSRDKVIDAFKNGLDGETFSQVEKIMKNPDETGLSVDDKVYVFCTGAKFVPSFLARVSNVSKLKDMFALLEKQQITKPLEEKSGCFVTEISGQATLAFNEKALVIYAHSNAVEKVIGWMSQTADKSMSANKGFQKMEGEKVDMATYLSMDALMNASSALNGAQGMPISEMNGFMPEGVNLKDMNLIYTLNFEKGKIALGVSNYTENEQLKKLYEENSTMCSDIKGTFSDFFPASTMFYMAMNVKGEGVYAYFQKVAKIKEALAQIPLDWEKLIGSFNGDISVGLTGLSAQGTPAITAYAEMKDDYVLKTLLTYKEMVAGMGGTFKENGENDYMISAQGMNVYFGMAKNHLYITTDEATYKNIGKSVSDPMTKAPWASGVKNSVSFVALNVNSIMQNPMVGMLIGMSGQKGQMAKSILSLVSYIDISGQMNQTGGMNIILNNKDINALQLICEEVEKLSGAF